MGHRLDQLFAAGWLSNTTGTSTGGRPSVRLEFDSTHAVVLAVDLETRHGRAAVLDLSGRILAEHTAQLLIADGPDLVLDTVAAWFPDLLARAAVEAECGVRDRAVGARSGRLGHRAGRQPADHAGVGRVPDPVTDAGGVRPAGESAAAPVPVLVDNDANLMAYAEQRHHYPDCSAFVLVKVSTGIGAGVVVGGEPYRGIDGGAGDIGHIRLHDRSDALCMCGSYGCLAAVASGRAIAGQLAAARCPHRLRLRRARPSRRRPARCRTAGA